MKKFLSSFICMLLILSCIPAMGEESGSSEGKVLISHENHTARSVWKDGDDMRVCIETEQGLKWHSFKDGALGEEVEEPEGVTLANAWDDIEKYMIFTGSNTDVYYTSEIDNRYPWQCSWNGYRLRRVTSRQAVDNQLWLTSPGQEARRLAVGRYDDPVVIPGTDYAVVSKRITGVGMILVKIDLNTGEESELWPEPVEYICPFLMLGGRLLISQGIDNPRYLWDPKTEEFTQVPGDFPWIYIGGCYRGLQPAGGDGLYYFTDTKTRGGTTLGIMDTVNMVFTPMMVFERMYLPPMDVWVDEENSCLYFVDDGDLLEIPFVAAKPEPDYIKVRVNGWPLDFTGIVSDDGRTHIDVKDNYFGNLGCIAGTSSVSDATLIFRNKKVLILNNGCDYMTEVDISGFNDLETLSADLLSGNPYEKSFVRTIPLDTKVIYGYVPLRAICEAFGANVEWNSAEGCIDIFIDNRDVDWPAREYIFDLMNLLLKVDEWKGSAPDKILI
ncbi:MAG: hypothetical protein J1F63_09935 [Oscillospiraceae bacterium]|nr:hypothetical protein [Oscillospiraceae bacterium]